MPGVFVVTDYEGEPVGVFRSFHAARTAAQTGSFDEVAEVVLDGPCEWQWKVVWRDTKSLQRGAPVYGASEGMYAGEFTHVFVVCDDDMMPRAVMRSLVAARADAERAMSENQRNYWVKLFALDAPCGRQQVSASFDFDFD